MKLTNSLQGILSEEIQRHALPNDFFTTIERWYLPVAENIATLHAQKKSTLLISFNGSQGSGKSTLTAFLRQILTRHFKLHSVELSIDDFYLTRAERQQLANDVHPLLVTRGVPGTHDIELARRTIDCLRNCSQHNPCRLPRFNKAIDDPVPRTDWPLVNEPVDIILFEGWCNHAPVLSEQALAEPINELEQLEDKDARWRTYANERLALYHQQLFDKADRLVFLQAPSFEKVYEWRGLQEQKLKQSAQADKHAVMDEQQLRRFIHHYERITRSCLEQLPAKADIVLKLDENHAIQSLSTKESTADG